MGSDNMDARGVLDILDLTLLDHDASESDLDELCKRANLHRPAAVCVFSCLLYTSPSPRDS